MTTKTANTSKPTASKPTASRAPTNPFRVASINGLGRDGRLGEIVTWSVPGEVPLDVLRAAVVQAGLTEALVPDLQPRHAFKRAVSELAERRIVRRVKSDGGLIRFQLTKETFNHTADEWEYDHEGHVELNADTGVITAPGLPESLRQQLQALLQTELGLRRTADMTRLLKRVYDRNADLVPLRPSGGVYFVPAAFESLNDQVSSVLTAVGGELRRLEVPDGGHSRESVAKSVRDDVVSLAESLLTDAKTLAADETASDRAKAGLIGRVRNGMSKLRFYKELLGELADEAGTTLDEALAVAKGEPVPSSGGDESGHSAEPPSISAPTSPTTGDESCVASVPAEDPRDRDDSPQDFAQDSPEGFAEESPSGFDLGDAAKYDSMSIDDILQLQTA